MKKIFFLIGLVLTLVLVTVNAQLTINDAIAVYRFEEGSGNLLIDSSPNNLDGSLNQTNFINSKGNNGTGNFATTYNGTDNFAQVFDNSLLNLTIPFSISLWVNITDAVSVNMLIYKNIIGTDENFGLEYDASEQLTIFHRIQGVGTVSVKATNRISIGNWVHIFAIVNGTGSTDAFLYFNNTIQPTVAGSSTGVDAVDESFYIGVDANLDLDFFGDLDEICIFDFSLSDAQKTDIFTNGCITKLNTTNLEVFQSKNPVEILEEFTLFANYTNATSNLPIENAFCFANSSISGGGQAGFGRGVLGIGGLSTINNAVHTQVNDIFGSNTLRVDIDNVPLGKASYAVNFRFHAHNQTPNDNLRVFATCHNNLTFSNFTLVGQVNTTESVISTSTENDTIWGFKNVVLFGAQVASENCSIVFESFNTSLDKHWMIADTVSPNNLNNSFTSDDFGVTYTLRPNANERSPFVDAGFGLDVPEETNMTFNATSGLYFLSNIRHGRPFDFDDRVFCSADQFENATNFVVTNVEDNVPPIVQIISIDPTVAVINVSNVTIQWTANDPELQVNFINVSFPNGSLLIQTELKPLILTPAQLTVLGNYSVVAFANDTGGLFTLDNATFEVADIDILPPNIILVNPSLNINNTRNNSIPFNISFSVSDNFPNDIICNLQNTTTILDTGTFTQSTDSILILAKGEVALDQEFSNLAITCFDNTELNNSATLLLNITLDSINPIIFPEAPIDNERFNKDIISSIQIKANCTDIPVFKLNITITNTSDTVASFETLTVVNNFLFIDEQLSISNLGVGNYTVTHTCSDPHTKQKIKDYTINKNSSDNKVKWKTPSGNEFEIKYSVPNKNPIQATNWGSSKSDDDSRYYFWYQLNETEDGTERDFNFELENRKFPITYLPNSEFKGHFIMENNWLDFEFGDSDATYEIIKNDNNNYEIIITTTKTLLNFSSVGELNTEVVTTTFEVFFIEQLVDFFTITECKTDTGSAILLALFIGISLFLITLGITTNVGFIGFFGSLGLLFTSFRIVPCISALASILILLSIVLMFFFIFRGVFSKNLKGLTDG